MDSNTMLLLVVVSCLMFGAQILVFCILKLKKVGDFFLRAMPITCKLCLKFCFKLACYFYTKHAEKQQRMKITPITITPVELQHLRNTSLGRNHKHQPVTIEHVD